MSGIIKQPDIGRRIEQTQLANREFDRSGIVKALLQASKSDNVDYTPDHCRGQEKFGF